MAVSDWSGNIRPYYIEGEALNLSVWWDAHQDVGKPIDCSFSNSFSGAIVWRGVFIVPDARPGQLVATVWNPPFPQEGIKLTAGSYVSACHFNNEAKASIGLNIIAIKPVDQP